ncbi:MAG: pitrilysin family protein, partial [Candidatus Aminicenantales bacterium]
ESSLKKMTGPDILRFYRERYRPDRCLASVVGAIDKAKLEALLQATLGRWKNPSTPAPALGLPPLPVPKGKTLLLVDKPDATQAYFMLGAPGYAVADPVHPTASVMNTLFGGRFTSWLNTELRIKRGLTYGAGSNFQTWKQGGLFAISSYTKNDKIGEMLDITLDLLGQAQKKGFADKEVESARNYILGLFPLSLEQNGDKAEAFVRLAFYGLGFDYYDGYLASVEKVTPPAAGQSAAKLLPKKDFVMVVVGKAAEIRPLLQKFGTFREKKISDAGF